MTTRSAAALVALIFALTGCASGGQSARDCPDPRSQSLAATSCAEPGARANATPHIAGLKCQNDLRVGGILDYVSATGGGKTPLKAVHDLAKPAVDTVIQKRSKAGATA